MEKSRYTRFAVQQEIFTCSSCFRIYEGTHIRIESEGSSTGLQQNFCLDCAETIGRKLAVLAMLWKADGRTARPVPPPYARPEPTADPAPELDGTGKA